MKSKNLLVLGSTSFTASHILHNLKDRFVFRRVGRDTDLVDIQFDACKDNIELLDEHLDWADVVINCFSNGDVDSCEENPDQSSQLNLAFPIALCSQMKPHAFHLVHFSSNAVYDGENPLYAENRAHLPVNTYGRLKSEADTYLLRESERCTILRPITMFGRLLGKQRHNPFSFFYEKLLNNQDIVAVNDVHVNMLHVDVLVQCVGKVIDDNIYGEFNISGDDVVNRFEFVSEIKRHLPQSTSIVTETDSSGFVTAAKRPRDTSFDNSKMKEVLGVSPQPLSQTIEALVEEAIEMIQPDDISRRAA